jgi:ubiquitin-protein ligase
MAGSSNPKILGRILKEIKLLSSSPPEGVRLIPHDTIGEVLAEIAGPSKSIQSGAVTA